MDLEITDSKLLKRSIISVVACIFVLIMGIRSCTVVSPTERGVKVTWGKVGNEILEPGLHLKSPIGQKIRTFKLEPKTYEVTFSVGNDGAITKDMQTVGATVSVRYIYDEARIIDVVTKYANDSIIKDAMKDNVKASLKETTGKYSIYELVSEQNAITQEVSKAMLERMKDYPIAISQTTITNWDWADSFNKQIEETNTRRQQVLQAEQEALVTAAQAQKMVKEAEARKQAAELDAQARVSKAKGDAEAKKIEADAIAYTNQKIAENRAVEAEKWKHEEQMEYYKKWDGMLVPTYIPLTAAGGIVNLSGKTQ